MPSTEEEKPFSLSSSFVPFKYKNIAPFGFSSIPQ